MCRHNDFESITMPAMPFAASQVLILPGLGGPQSAHWTVQWPQLHGHTLVDQHDWHSPLRGDWLMGLEEAVLARSGPLVLAADGLACLMVAAWASISRQAQRVVGALLVQPMAIDGEHWQARLPSWSPVVLQRLPFPSTVVAAADSSAARLWAPAWGSRCLAQAISEPAWPQGPALLREFIKD